MACEASQRITKKTETSRPQIVQDVKELGYCEENEKLKAEEALKSEEMQCLKRQNEELQAHYCGMMKQNDEELQAKNDDLHNTVSVLHPNCMPLPCSTYKTKDEHLV